MRFILKLTGLGQQMTGVWYKDIDVPLTDALEEARIQESVGLMKCEVIPVDRVIDHTPGAVESLAGEYASLLSGPYPLDPESVRLAESLVEKHGREDALALTALATSHLLAPYTDDLDRGKDLPEEDSDKAAEWVTIALDIAHWASPNAGRRD